MPEYVDRLASKLAPDSIKQTLVRAGCVLSAYELIKGEVVEAVHDFYQTGFDESGFIYDETRYRRDVLSRDKNRFRASCAWLVELDALTSEQVAILEQVHEHRNEIAHELPKLLIDPDLEVKADLLVAAVECVRRLGIFWGSISISTDPAWDGHDVDENDIKSGSYLLMEYIASLAGL